MLRGLSLRVSHHIRDLTTTTRTSQSTVSLSNVPNPIPATFLRGGTSKGIYLRREHLPTKQEDWVPIFLGIMGSPDPEHGRQLNGMGGGVSSLSKICVVGQACDALREEGLDVEYTFCQVGIRDSVLDYSGNCGNLSSMIGVFAVDEGLCAPRITEPAPGIGVVRAYNTNTAKRVDTTFPVSSEESGRFAVLNLPQASIAGVPGMASRIDLHFVSPAGARTGKLFSSGNTIDNLIFSHAGKECSIVASLVDATNPTVFIRSRDLARLLDAPDHLALDYADAVVEGYVEAIRQCGARYMGLDASAKAQPKIAVLSLPQSDSKNVHIVAHAFSMGVLHKAIPMTLGLCLGVAARSKGTIPWEMLTEARQDLKMDGPVELPTDLVRIRHPSGVVDVGAEFDDAGKVTSAKVVRTGRRLMKGVVYW